jgi:hypothetical protein
MAESDTSGLSAIFVWVCENRTKKGVNRGRKEVITRFGEGVHKLQSQWGDVLRREERIEGGGGDGGQSGDVHLNNAKEICASI